MDIRQTIQYFAQFVDLNIVNSPICNKAIFTFITSVFSVLRVQYRDQLHTSQSQNTDTGFTYILMACSRGIALPVATTSRRILCSSVPPGPTAPTQALGFAPPERFGRVSPLALISHFPYPSVWCVGFTAARCVTLRLSPQATAARLAAQR